MAWLDQHDVRVETLATTSVEGRTVVELLAHVGTEKPLAWPVAVVAESPDDLSVVFRTYCSQMPVDGHRHIRSPILDSTSDVPPQAGIAIYERSKSGLLAAVRVYDDIEPPI